MKTRLAAVLGRDVSASLSPKLHMAAAAAVGFDLLYLPINVTGVEHFGEVLRALRVVDAVGCNVTIPFKGDAFAAADTASSTAEALEVANLVRFEAGGVHVDNTDGPALLRIWRNFEDRHFDRVQIVGAGGAARACLWALAQRGAREVVVCARDSDQAQRAGALVSAEASELRPVAGATMVVSALPNDPALAAHILDDWTDLSETRLVYDLAYGSVADVSPLTRAARARGVSAADGLHMLVEQAVLSFCAWTHAAESQVRAAMEDAVGGLERLTPL